MKLRAVQVLSCEAGWAVMDADENVLGAGMTEADARTLAHRYNAHEGLVEALNAVWCDIAMDGRKMCRECCGLDMHKPDCLVDAALSALTPTEGEVS